MTGTNNIPISVTIFEQLRKDFSGKIYEWAALKQRGLFPILDCNQSPYFFNTIEQSIEVPDLLTSEQQLNMLDYLKQIPSC